MSSVKDVFLGISQRILEQLCQRAIEFSCSGHSRRNGRITQDLFMYLFIYFNLFNVDVLFFYNNIAILHTNMPIHYKKINIKIYATDKSKKIKKSQCES